MRIAEMEEHHDELMALENKIQTMLSDHDFPAVFNACEETFPHIVPSIKFRKKREIEPQTPDLFSFLAIVKYAPLLFEHWIIESFAAKLNPNNFSACKTRLLKVVEVCRGIGFDVPVEQEELLVKDLKEQYEKILREDFQRQEQARIRAQIREEERLAREIDKKVKEAEREQSAIAAALEKALEKTKDEHSAEVELLRARLKEAEDDYEFIERTATALAEETGGAMGED